MATVDRRRALPADEPYWIEKPEPWLHCASRQALQCASRALREVESRARGGELQREAADE